ncbi:cytochrome P450 [Streptomyces sp. NPDC058301]|uniref:cytochrome P450 n=1 Tax=Streptomyces sp. NPDC058301 TaxID=3346436 RepID=UPI0036EB52E0
MTEDHASAEPATPEHPSGRATPHRLHGTLIREGDAVCATMLGATWDPAHYRNPSRFDVQRQENADPTFGAGPHYCLGAAQALP